MQHEQIMAKIKDLLWTDPDDMLEDDKALLEEDCGKLGSSTATSREFRVASMAVAISAAEHKRRRDNSNTDNVNSEDHVLRDPDFDDEGSLRYWKCRQT